MFSYLGEDAGAAAGAGAVTVDGDYYWAASCYYYSTCYSSWACSP